MVKVRRAAKSSGTSRTRRQKPSTGVDSRTLTKSSHARSAFEEDTDSELFSLRDVARNTDFHRFDQRDANSRLREQAIHFVKSSDPLKGTRNNAEEELDSKNVESHLHENNLKGYPTRAADHDHSPQRAASPTPSDSSDEVVLFTGRKHVSQYSHTSQSLREGELTLQTSILLDKVPIQHDAKHVPELLSNSHAIKSVTENEGDSVSHGRFTRKRQSESIGNNRGSSKLRSPRMDGRNQSYSDASLVDYMQNMEAHGELDDDFVMQAHVFTQELDGWDAQDLEDFDGISTSEDTVDAIELVLARRHRLSGLQYLVLRQGQSVNEARWIHHQAPSIKEAAQILKQFEEQRQQGTTHASGSNSIGRSMSSNSDSDKEEAEEDDYADEIFSDMVTDDSSNHDDDASLLEDQAMARMTDEQIARLLSKQEELGMGSDELILFDDLGHDTEDLGANDNFTLLRDAHVKKRSKNAKKKKKKKKKKQKRPHEYHSDSLDSLPQEINSPFDIMDFDRPSISRKPKLKQEPWFGLSDPELEAELREQFAADRQKKQAKKQEREKLRAQGLLGKQNKFKPDMKARYHDGLSISQLKHEMEDFLNHDSHTLAMPPMRKSERKTVHEIASQFNLKSKSVGSGKSRFPILYKTSHTTDFDARVFDRVERKLQRHFLPRLDKQTKSKGTPSKRSGGGGITSGTGYAEGETVGASAPELGSDNRGRAMLEKMGWSTGMALGALDNKGILQPITHIVKKTRAGLG